MDDAGYLVFGLGWEPQLNKLNETGKTLWELLLEEGLSCFTDSNRLAQIRNNIYSYIRAACNYRGTVLRVVNDIVQVCRIVQTIPTYEKDARIHLLRLAAHLCARYEVEDDEVISYVMSELFVLAGDLNDWFEFLSPFGDLGRLQESGLYPFKPDTNGVLREWITEKHLKALDYYLTASKTVHILHRSQGTKEVKTRRKKSRKRKVVPQEEELEFMSMVNWPMDNALFGRVTPLTLATLSGSAESVLLLLRHGALPVHPYQLEECPYHNWAQPLYNLVNQINLRNLGQQLGAALENELREAGNEGTEHERRYFQADRPRSVRALIAWRGRKLLRCLGHVTRVLPVLPIRLCPEENMVTHRCGSALVHMSQRLAPFLPRRCQWGLGELQHQARCAIRKQLSLLGHLPEGVQALPLPNLLKQYVDLQFD